jgi:predicted dehydrogenase
VEKPVADTVAEGLALAEAARRADVPVLVGHHRRHNPVIQKARSLIRQEALGRIVAVNVLATFLKPDAYFRPAWRRSSSGGPVLINLIHEIDLIRFLFGEVSSLRAITSNAARGHEVEDTAGVVLGLASGAVATLTLADAAASPWSWDTASGENPSFPRSAEDSHYICGSGGSLALPSLKHWRYEGEPGWHHLLSESRLAVDASSPYVEQARHFGAVVRREERPMIDALDATRTLRITLAIREAAASGGEVRFE